MKGRWWLDMACVEEDRIFFHSSKHGEVGRINDMFVNFYSPRNCIQQYKNIVIARMRLKESLLTKVHFPQQCLLCPLRVWPDFYFQKSRPCGNHDWDLSYFCQKTFDLKSLIFVVVACWKKAKNESRIGKFQKVVPPQNKKSEWGGADPANGICSVLRFVRMTPVDSLDG